MSSSPLSACARIIKLFFNLFKVRIRDFGEVLQSSCEIETGNRLMTSDSMALKEWREWRMDKRTETKSNKLDDATIYNFGFKKKCTIFVNHRVLVGHCRFLCRDWKVQKKVDTLYHLLHQFSAIFSSFHPK